MAAPETRTIDTLRRIDVASPRLRQAGQRPEIRATCLLYPSGPLGEWHPAIPSREPLQEISPYSPATGTGASSIGSCAKARYAQVPGFSAPAGTGSSAGACNRPPFRAGHVLLPPTFSLHVA